MFKNKINSSGALPDIREQLDPTNLSWADAQKNGYVLIARLREPYGIFEITNSDEYLALIKPRICVYRVSDEVLETIRE